MRIRLPRAQVVTGGCASSSSLVSNNYAIKTSVAIGRLRDVVGWTCGSWFPGATITAYALCCPPQQQQAAFKCDYSNTIISTTRVV